MATNKWAQDQPFPVGMVEEWNRIADEEPPGTVASGLLSYDRIFNSGLVFPLQRRRELEAMITIAKGISPVTVMEIGADKGGGLYHWCRCIPTIRNVIACEIRGTPYREAFGRMFPYINFLWLEGDSLSKQVTNTVRHFTRNHSPIDCIFIDGNKNRMDDDFNAYLPLMRKSKALAFMHDVQDSPPKDCFHRVRQRYPNYHTSVILDKGDVEEIRDRPPTNAYESWLKHWNGRSCGVGVIQVKG